MAPSERLRALLRRRSHLNGCARFFNAARETVSDRFLVTYKAGEPRPDLANLKGSAQ